ncbi:MAG: matrixin family metalloprotease [archaeon]
MKKYFVTLLICIFLISVVSASMIIPANDKAKENSKAPEKSQEISENWGLERIDFVHYAKPNNPSKPPKNPTQENCYKLLGVKWKSLPVNYVINPTNTQGLSEQFITSTISASAETWDSATSLELFSNSYITNYNAEFGQDFQNTILFGDYKEEGVIGVTSIWYMRKGKQIVEFDIILDTDFNWGDATLNPSLMDLENIATHELGHGVGMGDIYTSTCSEVTMYGYSTEGETKKRTLEQPDIAGLQNMYSF